MCQDGYKQTTLKVVEGAEIIRTAPPRIHEVMVSVSGFRVHGRLFWGLGFRAYASFAVLQYDQ